MFFFLFVHVYELCNPTCSSPSNPFLKIVLFFPAATTRRVFKGCVRCRVHSFLVDFFHEGKLVGGSCCLAVTWVLHNIFSKFSFCCVLSPLQKYQQINHVSVNSYNLVILYLKLKSSNRLKKLFLRCLIVKLRPNFSNHYEELKGNVFLRKILKWLEWIEELANF